MLARLYSIKSHERTAQPTSQPPTLSDRLLRECAVSCLEAAQRITSLVADTFNSSEPIGLLPWWYRIYYLHIAGTHFLAAMFERDLFTVSVEQSWHRVLAALRAHEHLSLYVQQCVRTFEVLAAKIQDSRYAHTDRSGGAMRQGETPALYLDDIFQDMDFDFDDFLVGVEDSTSRML